MLNQQIKGYDAHINQQGNLEAHTSTLKIIQRFTSFQISTESDVKVKYASNSQRYNHAPLVVLVNTYQLIHPSHTPMCI